jgi:hypothetical protein
MWIETHIALSTLRFLYELRCIPRGMTINRLAEWFGPVRSLLSPEWWRSKTSLQGFLLLLCTGQSFPGHVFPGSQSGCNCSCLLQSPSLSSCVWFSHPWFLMVWLRHVSGGSANYHHCVIITCCIINDDRPLSPWSLAFAFSHHLFFVITSYSGEWSQNKDYYFFVKRNKMVQHFKSKNWEFISY